MKYPLHGHRTVEVATTYNQKYYDIIGKRMVESFVRHWPKHIQLHVYWQEAEPEIIEDNIVYLGEICPDDSLCTFFDRPKFRDETGFYMHNPQHPKAKQWADRLEEIYLSGEVWTYAKDRAADQYTMAFGRDSFRDCKQMDLMTYHEGVDPKDPVPTSPLSKFLQHLKGEKKQS